MFWKRRKRTTEALISPEEILLDAHNLPAHDPHNAEGRINTPIGPRALIPLILIALATGLLLIGRSVQLMAIDGDTYQELSERNRLGHSPILAERGIIYDRNGVELAWNIPHLEDGAYEVYDERTYASTTGSGHLLGYIRMPARDTSGVLYREGIEGVSGVELAYDDVLRGSDGVRIVETDAQLNVVSEGLLEEPTPGQALTLSIDTRLQEALNGIIKDLANEIPFRGGAGLLMDVKTGELLALTSYPEYDPRALVTGEDEVIASYSTDERTPYLNRTLAGVYTPGSIVKPYIAAAALAEGIVRPETSFVSTGALRLANPYNPGQYSVFTDWRAHGIVDLTRALAVSSNVYFYYVGGGFGDQEGLGITRIGEYMRMFGFARTTDITLEGEQQGTVPSPEWKEETFPTDPVWRIGDTYNTAIGQYGFLVTPLQVVRAVGALANDGLLLTPRIETEHTHYTARPIDISQSNLQTVRAGMRRAVLEGTAKGLNVPFVNVAGKTGTAEVGVSKDHVHSWAMGFYPYEEPRYAFVVMMEYGPRKNLIGGVYVMRQFLDWMHKHTPEYVLFDEAE